MTETVKVKPWGIEQGEFVLIDKAEFDADTHELYESPEGGEDAPKRRGRKPAEQVEG